MISHSKNENPYATDKKMTKFLEQILCIEKSSIRSVIFITRNRPYTPNVMILRRINTPILKSFFSQFLEEGYHAYLYNDKINKIRLFLKINAKKTYSMK